MTHEAFDAATARRVPLRVQGRVDPGCAISAAMCQMDPPDLGQQGAIGRLARAFRPATPGIIPRRRDAHHIAHDADRERLALILNETEFHFGASETMLASGDGWTPASRTLGIGRDEWRDLRPQRLGALSEVNRQIEMSLHLYE